MQQLENQKDLELKRMLEVVYQKVLLRIKTLEGSNVQDKQNHFQN